MQSVLTINAVSCFIECGDQAGIDDPQSVDMSRLIHDLGKISIFIIIRAIVNIELLWHRSR